MDSSDPIQPSDPRDDQFCLKDLDEDELFGAAPASDPDHPSAVVLLGRDPTK